MPKMVLSAVSIVVCVEAFGCTARLDHGTVDWSEHARRTAAMRLASAPAAISAPSDGSLTTACIHPAVSADHKVHLAADGAATATEPASEREAGPLPGFWETVKRDVKAAPRGLWDDTKATFGNKYNVLFLLGAGGASAALRPEVDDDVEDYYDDHHSFKEDWRDAFGAIGNPGTHFALAGLWYLAGQQGQDVKTYEVGKQTFGALSITGLTTLLLKAATNTTAPNGENFGWPSGHVSSSMAFATVMNDAYGPVVGVPLFGLTALVGVERLDSGEHHLSDVVFGAALGWVVAETVMTEHQPELFGGRLVPYADPVGGSAGLAWVKSFH